MRRAHVTAAVGGVLVALLAAGCGGGGSGTPPRPPAGPPAAPSGAAAVALSAEGIQLTWTDNSADETGFEIQWSMSAEGPFTHRGTVNANVAAYDDFGLGASGTYFYRVRATSAADASTWSGTASATTQDDPWNPPVEPAGVAAAALSTSAIQITWTDQSTDETAFEIERATSFGGPFVQAATVKVNVTQYEDGSLSPSTTYFYRVHATNAAGASYWSSTVSATTQAATPPAAPSGAAASALSASAIRVTWTDASANESAFEVERATSGGGPFANVATLPAGSTQLDSSGLAASTAYFFRVRATNAAGASPWSSTVSATTQAPAPTPPSAPTGIAATALSSSAIRVTWTDTSANESAFGIERATSAGGPFVSIGTLTAGSTLFDSTGLAASTTYFFRARATNAAGASAWSGTASATTQIGPIQTVVLYPVADNRIASSVLNTGVAATAYPADELIVGCNWLFNSYLGTQEGTCFGSAVKFDVSALQNRTIEAAAVWLWAYSPPPVLTTYTVHAMATSWSPSTLTWNNGRTVYTTGGWQVTARATSGPLGWSVTDIVRNWTRGAWVNNGLLFQDAYQDFPYLSSLRATSFYSSDYYSALDRRPYLVVDYR